MSHLCCGGCRFYAGPSLCVVGICSRCSTVPRFWAEQASEVGNKAHGRPPMPPIATVRRSCRANPVGLRCKGKGREAGDRRLISNFDKQEETHTCGPQEVPSQPPKEPLPKMRGREHLQRSRRCEICGGSSICEHDCMRSQCKMVLLHLRAQPPKKPMQDLRRLGCKCHRFKTPMQDLWRLGHLWLVSL